MRTLLGLACVLLGLLGTAPAAAQATLLELNTASQAELEQLSGVGPALSDAVLATRRQAGAFRDWHDLIQRIKGMGPARARRLSDAGLRVDGQPYPAVPARPAGSGPR